ncbi:MAG: hypothetical protein LT102_02580 [Burkholderiaceae bacterium]|nr:hypothetical protein [Burkholderiaceae bacterium]
MTFIVTHHVTKRRIGSMIAASIKAGLFAAYFGFFFDGSYTFLDDWTYIAGGAQLLHGEVGITNLQENWSLLGSIAGGDHFFYYLYNSYAFRLFGEGYYAPVALNVLATVAIAWIGTGLATIEFNLGRRIYRWLFFFLLLHPDILAWSNIMNGKDILVLLLHVILLVAVSNAFRGYIYRALWFAVPSIGILLFLRFYVPLLFGVALISTWLLIGFRHRLKFLIISGAWIWFAFVWIGQDYLISTLALVRGDFVNPLYGFFRILLTPTPMSASGPYEFLIIPAIIHWGSLPFFLLGLRRVWVTRTPFAMFLVSYLFVFLALYAVYGELQGPRHRVQLDYAWALLQFIGAVALLRRRRMVARVETMTSRGSGAIRTIQANAQ